MNYCVQYFQFQNEIWNMLNKSDFVLLQEMADLKMHTLYQFVAVFDICWNSESIQIFAEYDNVHQYNQLS